jgi:uncharacterized damage-inducible protein DinB
VDDLLKELEGFPRFLVDALDTLGDPRARERPAPQSWSLAEQIWHLADLEREGWLVRIERLLSESAPALPDFDGDAIAEARDYRSKDPYLGLQRFRSARSATLARLRALNTEQWKRAGTLEGAGPLALADLPRRMREHDEGHRREIAALLERP